MADKLAQSFARQLAGGQSSDNGKDNDAAIGDKDESVHKQSSNDSNIGVYVVGALAVIAIVGVALYYYKYSSQENGAQQMTGAYNNLSDDENRNRS